MTDDVDSQLLISGIVERGCSRARKDRLLREASDFHNHFGELSRCRCNEAWDGIWGSDLSFWVSI